MPETPALHVPVVAELETIQARVEPKNGLATTEFWLTLAVLVAASVLLGLGKIDADQWMLVAGGSSGAYALARGLAKRS